MYIQKNEEGENEETELQAPQQRPATHKREWLVDVVGKPNVFKLYLNCFLSKI